MSNLAVYIKRPEVIQKFQDVLGRGANGYVQSVAIAVASNDELLKCTEQSVVMAALRAASLGLSCDPAQREAHLVPRNKKIKGKDGQPDRLAKEASFEVHYLGLYKLAIRTGKYWTINVIPVLKNQDVRMGIDGLHYIYEGNMKVDHFPVDRVTAKNIEGVKGWLGYFKTTKGFEKTAYMSVEEIMDHAAQFSKSYQKDLENNTRYSLWSNKDLLPTMQMKTVLRDLLKWADTSGDAGAALQEALRASEDVIDAEEVDEVDSEFPPSTDYEQQSEEDDAAGGASKSKAVPRENNVPTLTAQFLVDDGVMPNKPHAEALMKLLGIPEGSDIDAGMKRIKLYMSWRKIYAKQTPKDRELAAKKAIAGEVPD